MADTLRIGNHFVPYENIRGDFTIDTTVDGERLQLTANTVKDLRTQLMERFGVEDEPMPIWKDNGSTSEQIEYEPITPLQELFADLICKHSMNFQEKLQDISKKLTDNQYILSVNRNYFSCFHKSVSGNKEAEMLIEEYDSPVISIKYDGNSSIIVSLTDKCYDPIRSNFKELSNGQESFELEISEPKPKEDTPSSRPLSA